ncbi:MAG: hypothetical protein WAK95_02150 [Desulfobacterales bacterium]
MRTSPQPSLTCRTCGKTKSKSQMIPAALVRNAIVERIRMASPTWSPEGYICATDLNRFRVQYIESLLNPSNSPLVSGAGLSPSA